jgi:short subunit dehydrogenase-like uncharacterized protein
MSGLLVVYGASGYTGRLILAEARARGVDVVAAGRSRERLAGLGAPVRVAAADHPGELAAAFAGARVVINAAGPFHLTAAPVLRACLKVGAHYLDVGGEGPTFEALARYDEPARRAGMMVMPGAGYVVAASDALAAHVARRLPHALRLWFGFSRADPISRGSLASMLDLADSRVTIRRGGRLVAVPSGSLSRAFDFGEGPSPCMLVPWPDPFSAYLTTAIPNIEAHLEADPMTQCAYRTASLFAPALKLPMARLALDVLTQGWPEGPSEAERAATPKIAIAEAEDAYGRRVAARLSTPNVYSFTRDCVVALARRALGGDAPAGFQTPAGAYGPDFPLELPGVRRDDLL